jgi:GGDEF domain-containing protein
MATTFGNPRLRAVAGVPVTPAERLHELATPPQMHGRFTQLQEICGRLGVPVTAVVVRLDGLDRLRDEVGAGAPVFALAAAAEAIGAQIRAGDEFGRWSEDELAVICPGAATVAVEQLAARLGATIEQVRVRHVLLHDVEVTLPLRPVVRVTDTASEHDESLSPRHLHVA